MSLRSKFARALYANMIPPDLCDPGLSIEAIKPLFKLHVRLVEIENHSFCNRTCWFCPNATLDRRSETIPIDPGLYDRILNDLASVEYDQTVMWCRYHEPLSEESIFANIAKARAKLPKAFLAITTNGDYLTRDKLKRLEDTGLDYIHLNVYLPEGKDDDEAYAEGEWQKLLKRSGLIPGRPDVWPKFYHMEGTKIHVLAGVRIFRPETAQTRGGLVQINYGKKFVRTSACFSPIKHLAVDYNGKGMLCCQVRSDAPEHKDAIIGDLSNPDYSMFHFYRDLAGARAALLRGGPKTGVCSDCTSSAWGPDRYGRNEVVSRILNMLPGASAMFDRAVRKKNLHRQYEEM